MLRGFQHISTKERNTGTCEEEAKDGRIFNFG